MAYVATLGCGIAPTCSCFTLCIYCLLCVAFSYSARALSLVLSHLLVVVGSKEYFAGLLGGGQLVASCCAIWWVLVSPGDSQSESHRLLPPTWELYLRLGCGLVVQLSSLLFLHYSYWAACEPFYYCC